MARPVCSFVAQSKFRAVSATCDDRAVLRDLAALSQPTPASSSSSSSSSPPTPDASPAGLPSSDVAAPAVAQGGSSLAASGVVWETAMIVGAPPATTEFVQLALYKGSKSFLSRSTEEGFSAPLASDPLEVLEAYLLSRVGEELAAGDMPLRLFPHVVVAPRLAEAVVAYPYVVGALARISSPLVLDWSADVGMWFAPASVSLPFFLGAKSSLFHVTSLPATSSPPTPSLPASPAPSSPSRSSFAAPSSAASGGMSFELLSLAAGLFKSFGKEPSEAVFLALQAAGALLTDMSQLTVPSPPPGQLH